MSVIQRRNHYAWKIYKIRKWHIWKTRSKTFHCNKPIIKLPIIQSQSFVLTEIDLLQKKFVTIAIYFALMKEWSSIVVENLCFVAQNLLFNTENHKMNNIPKLFRIFKNPTKRWLSENNWFRMQYLSSNDW